MPRMAVKVMPMPPRMATGIMGMTGKRVLVVWPMRYASMENQPMVVMTTMATGT